MERLTDEDFPDAEIKSSGGFKKRIIELFSTLPLESECDLFNMLAHLQFILNEFESAAVSKYKEDLSAKILPILESMDSKIFDKQKIDGFETFFDFIGEDIESIKSLLSNPR